MVWARVALVSGLLLLAVAFAFGTEKQHSTSGRDHTCGTAISASLLVTGTPDQILNPGLGATTDQRQTAAACAPVIQEARVIVLTTMGAAGLLALAGLASIREQREPDVRRVEPAHV